DAPPPPARGPEDAPQLLLRGQIALARDAAGEGVDDARAAVFDQRYELDEAGQDVERLEAGHDDRELVPLHERLEDRGPGDRRRVARGEEALDLRLRHLRHDLHDRRDVL